MRDIHLFDAEGFEVYFAAFEAALEDIALMALDYVHYYAGYYYYSEEDSEDDDEEDPEGGDVCAALEVDVGEETGVVAGVELVG